MIFLRFKFYVLSLKRAIRPGEEVNIMNIKKFLVGSAAGAIMLGAIAIPAFAAGPTSPNGWTPYADVYVTWDGLSSSQGSWQVDTNFDGTGEFGCLATDFGGCLDMNYDFSFKGNTLQFEEVYVDAAIAHPQTHNVVLKDNDGDGTYEGAITARYDAPWSATCPVRMDVIDYTVVTNDGTVEDFSYIEHEYCLPTK